LVFSGIGTGLILCINGISLEAEKEPNLEHLTPNINDF
ncbi:MAG: hypothetical protein ACI8X3_001859, partial [Saprospiraceae bacterium]